jgi:hypothetical protein
MCGYDITAEVDPTLASVLHSEPLVAVACRVEILSRVATLI